LLFVVVAAAVATITSIITNTTIISFGFYLTEISAGQTRSPSTVSKGNTETRLFLQAERPSCQLINTVKALKWLT